MQIERMIREYLNQNVLFGDEGITYDEDTSFLDAGILDSMAVLDLITWIESTFRVKTEVRDLTPENFDSVRKLAAYIRRLAPPPAPSLADSVAGPAIRAVLAPQS